MRGITDIFTGVVDTVAGEWDSAVGDFRAAMAALDTASVDLESVRYLAERDSASQAEWEEANTKLQMLHSSISAVREAIRDVGNWWGDVTNWFDSSEPVEQNGTGLSGLAASASSGLGFAFPAIPIAAVIGAAAAAWAVVSAVNATVERIQARYRDPVFQNTTEREEYRERLADENPDLTPEQIEAEVNKTYPLMTATPLKSWSESLGDVVKWGALVALVFLFIRERRGRE